MRAYEVRGGDSDARTRRALPIGRTMMTDDLLEEIQSHFGRIQQAAIHARAGRDRLAHGLEEMYAWCLRDVEAVWRQEDEKAHRAYQEELAAGQAVFEEATSRIRTQVAEMDAAFPWAVAAWDDPIWDAYAPATDAPIPSGVRIGRLIAEGDGLPPLPALAWLIGRGHIFLWGQEMRLSALQLLQAILLRLTVSAIPGTVRLIMADPGSVGANLAMFRRLPEELRGAKIWSSPQEIEAQLHDLVSHIETVIQTRLIGPNVTIEAYNQQKPEQRVPYRILALADFPFGFSERAAESLLAVARNGPRAGVYIMAHVNSAHPCPRNCDLDALTAMGTNLHFTAWNRMGWDDPMFGTHAIEPDHLPHMEHIDPYLAAVGHAAARNTTELSFGRIGIARSERWQGTTLDGLDVPIGVNSKGEPHSLRLGQDPGVVHHGLIGGTIGSGKGNLLHVLISQLALRYPPEELGLFLLDFKEGVEFQRYISLPHARAVALESEREFGLNVLRHLRDEMEARGRLYKSRGSNISKLSEYRRSTREPLARLVLIIDEFQVLFKDDDAMARDAAQILEDIAKRGRSAGIHVLLCSQSPSTGGQMLTRIYDQMGLRIALQCRARDAMAILGEGNDAAVHLERVGEAIYNDRMGDRDKNHLIRVARLDEEERQRVLEAILELAGAKPYPVPITFDGRSQARIGDNTALQALLEQPGWLSPGMPAQAWLGEPVDLKPPTVAALECYARSNLLIAGDNERDAHGLLLAVLFSLAAQHAPGCAAFYIADFARRDEPIAGLFARLAGSRHDDGLAHSLSLADARQADTLLRELLSILKDRVGRGDAREPRQYFFIAGLHRWREMRGLDAITQSETAKQLMRLAEEGPEVGIHLVMWADSLAIVEQAFRRGGYKHFDLRVALRLSLRDSTELFGTNVAATLADNRACFRHEDWEMGRRERFKPYALPTEDEFNRILGAIAAKTARERRETVPDPTLARQTVPNDPEYERARQNG